MWENVGILGRWGGDMGGGRHEAASNCSRGKVHRIGSLAWWRDLWCVISLLPALSFFSCKMRTVVTDVQGHWLA